MPTGVPSTVVPAGLAVTTGGRASVETFLEAQYATDFSTLTRSEILAHSLAKVAAAGLASPHAEHRRVVEIRRVLNVRVGSERRPQRHTVT